MSNASRLVNDEELDRYEQAVKNYLGAQLDAERFTALRLQQGVYGQRQEGVNMVRIKVPGGRLTPGQLTVIAEVLERYPRHDVVHITTRQDIQVHHVPLEHTPAVLRRLAQAGLTTREACGNTVRNITTCPLAGVCPREHVDVTPFLHGTVSHFLRHPLTQSLPRKFKISISGCEADCAQGLMHDLGVVAVRNEHGRFGFKVLAGGGLGHKPHEAIVVEPFIEEKDLLAVMEAIIVLHNRYSDRSKRAKSRIKFLVDRFGAEGFVEKYREELARTRAALADRPYAKGDWKEGGDGDVPGAGAPRRLFPQKQAGLYVVPVSVPLGELAADQLRGIAALMKQCDLHDVRTTQDQNLMLLNVPEKHLPAISLALRAHGLGVPQTGDNVVACPGTSTCRLGITSSMTVAPKLSGGRFDLRIRISGCHNGCAQPETGDIGIFGEGKRLHGKLIPHYQLYFGGDGCGGGGLALRGPSVPAARIEQAIERVQEAYTNMHAPREPFFHWVRRQQAGYFDRLLAELVQVSAVDVPQAIRDHGHEAEFKVLQLGGGECAGVAHDLLAAKFFEVAYERDCRNAFVAQRKYEEALDCAEATLCLVGQALLFTSGQDHKVNELSAVARQLQEGRSAHLDLSKQLVELAERLAQLSAAFDEGAFPRFTAELDAWAEAAAGACTGAPPRRTGAGPLSAKKTEGGADEMVDLSADPCPVNFLKAKLALEKLAAGEVLNIKLLSGPPAERVPASLESIGHAVLSRQEQGDITLISVRKVGN